MTDETGRFEIPGMSGDAMLSVVDAPEPWVPPWGVPPVLVRPGQPLRELGLVRGGYLTAQVFATDAREDLELSLTVGDGAGNSDRSTRHWTPGATVRLGPYAPGRVEVSGELQGHGPILKRTVEIVAGQDTDLGTLAPVAGGALSIRLLVPGGVHPGPCIVICAVPGQPKHGDYLGHANLTADDPPDRVLEVRGLAAGAWVVRVASESHADAICEVAVTAGGTAHVELTLEPLARLPVCLVDADGRAVMDVRIRTPGDRRVWGDWDGWDPVRSAAGRIAGERIPDVHGRLLGRPGRWRIEGWSTARSAWLLAGEVDVQAGENPEATFVWPSR